MEIVKCAQTGSNTPKYRKNENKNKRDSLVERREKYLYENILWVKIKPKHFTEHPIIPSLNDTKTTFLFLHEVCFFLI